VCSSKPWAAAAGPRLRSFQDRSLVVALGAVAILALAVSVWAMRYAIVINRLTQ
jgi:hypothetical protein